MAHDPRKLLEDMRLAAASVSRFTSGKTESDYADDDLLRSAVERQFEILGEALSRLMKVDPGLATQISEHRRIIGFRNVLIHGYDSISHAVVWDIIQKDLPLLRTQVQELLANYPA